jgi:murein DD-endopeptidase MepM/ murein hydrolase activator NlpD
MIGRAMAAAAIATLLAVATLGGGADASAAGSPARWAWPLDRPAVLRGFTTPPDPYAAGHRGIDLAAARGQAVSSPAAGTVVFAGVVVDRPVVTVATAQGVLISMEPVEAALPVGAPVARDGPLGTVAEGGHCDARCLHLGVRVNGAYVSPLLFLAGVPPAVLLPLD